MTSSDINHLRRELSRRIKSSPLSTWSPEGLTVMIALFDFAMSTTTSATPAPTPSGPPQLRVIKGGA